MAICLVSAAVTVGISLTIGDYDIGFLESYQIVWDHITGNVQDTLKDHIVVDLRMPRIVIGLITGAGLAIAGVVMQGILKNPLADPYTTGLSSGAGFGATIAVTAGMTIVGGDYAIVINAFVFSLIPLFLILFISQLKNASATMIIMCGLAIMYVFDAMSTLMKLWANPHDLAAIYRWQVGTLSGAGWAEIPLMLAVVVAGAIAIQFLAGRLNVISLGDESARSLGVDAEKLRILFLGIVALVTSVVVSFTGLIGFVGLVCPHIVRLFVGHDNKMVVIGSAFFGMALLTLADLIGRTVLSPAVINVGVIMAFIGGPMLLWLMIRKNPGGL